MANRHPSLNVEDAYCIFGGEGQFPSVYRGYSPTLDILVESDTGEITRYRLCENKGIFLLRVDEQTRLDPAMGRYFSLSTSDPEVASSPEISSSPEFAGRDDKEVALEYFFRKILKKWGSKVQGPEMETALRSVRW